MLFLSWFGKRPIIVHVPAENLDLSTEIAKSLNGTTIPHYVLKYAPYVYLDREDAYLPSDMATHISSTHATLNFTPIEMAPERLSLQNLDSLNKLGGDQVYLTSTENVIKLPKYLRGTKPDPKTLQTKDAVSCVIIIVNKDSGIVDAFYMYFYSFNAGPTALGHIVGNHLGDWEHNMIRFENGKPLSIWYSQHEYGEAFRYDAVTKVGVRPLVFSAKGSHANYAKPGRHDLHEQNEKVPNNIAYDHTSSGHLWDPMLSAYYYTYSMDTQKLTPAKGDMPVNYLYFEGRWGDQEYGDEVEGQELFRGYHKWTGGPQGPIFKHLDRRGVCLPRVKRCIIKGSLGEAI
ncbi:hypothetical protein B0O99DRAFT_516521 [Bisporella sp. PMI_857]|nr:hypothetical protein B0O99DRAFT_516521 [Bisporella sp. PMI_857]